MLVQVLITARSIVRMKFVNVLVLFVSAIAVTAAPAADLDTDVLQVEDGDFDFAAFEAEASLIDSGAFGVEARNFDPAAFEVEARDLISAPGQIEARQRRRPLTRAQCKASCRNGSESMEAVCRRIRRPLPKALCWGVAAGLETSAGNALCDIWCDNWVR